MQVAQTWKFELQVQPHNLDHEKISKYLDRAEGLATKLLGDDMDVGMTTLKGMRDEQKRESQDVAKIRSADANWFQEWIRNKTSSIRNPSTN